MASTSTTRQDTSELQNSNVLSLFNNVPETNLSTLVDPVECAHDQTGVPAADGSTLGLEWNKGIAKLPGSDFQFRMNENGDVEVLSNKSDDDSSNEDNALKIDDSFDGSPTNTINLATQSNSGDTNENIMLGRTKSEKFYPDAPFSTKCEKSIVQYLPKESKPFNEKIIKTCDYCGKSNQKKYFMGRFCSKVCIAKHAVATRKKRSSNKEIKSQFPQKNSALYESGVPSSDKLKLKIRLPVSSKLQTKSRTFEKRAYHRFSHLKKRKLFTIMEENISDFHTFNWESYLATNSFKSLTSEKFEMITGRSAYPLRENPFKVGDFLEAIDPMHQSLICLVLVAQIEGFRMRLHFEGYLEPFDFWVNADSPFIFPCGFCKNTGRKLSAPETWDTTKNLSNFDAFFGRNFNNTTNFKIGDKFEAVDRKHQDLMCVATVDDVIGDYILVHFDGWEKDYDYWANSQSPFIRPVGWCEANNQILTSPPSYDVNTSFVWQEYLQKSKAVAASSSCFSPRSEKFEENTKIEVVDQRNPILVRVATITEVSRIRIKVYFDGWNHIFDDWIDVDSHDIHPIYWCSKANFLLHPPVDCQMVYKKPCPTIGCSGLGHCNSPGNLRYHKKHYTEHGCPYSQKNFGKHVYFDRFATHLLKDVGAKIQKHKNFDQRGNVNQQHGKRRKLSRSRLLSLEPYDLKKPKLRRNMSFQSYDSQHRKTLLNPSSNIASVQPTTRSITNVYGQDHAMSLKEKVVRSSVLSSLATLTTLHLPPCWDKNVKHLPGVDGLNSTNVSKWDINQVSSFVQTLTGKAEYADAFKREEIDGEAMLLLTQNDIIKTLKVKLGPAVKIYNAVLLFKVLDENNLE